MARQNDSASFFICLNFLLTGIAPVRESCKVLPVIFAQSVARALRRAPANIFRPLITRSIPLPNPCAACVPSVTATVPFGAQQQARHVYMPFPCPLFAFRVLADWSSSIEVAAEHAAHSHWPQILHRKYSSLQPSRHRLQVPVSLNFMVHGAPCLILQRLQLNCLTVAELPGVDSLPTHRCWSPLSAHSHSTQSQQALLLHMAQRQIAFREDTEQL